MNAEKGVTVLQRISDILTQGVEPHTGTGECTYTAPLKQTRVTFTGTISAEVGKQHTTVDAQDDILG